MIKEEQNIQFASTNIKDKDIRIFAECIICGETHEVKNPAPFFICDKCKKAIKQMRTMMEGGITANDTITTPHIMINSCVGERKCPQCGGSLHDDGLTYTSNPPCTKLVCDKCGYTEWKRGR